MTVDSRAGSRALRLDDMSLFVVIVREGSLTAAARALGITKQSVSERLMKLERALGVGLLARSTRRMRLTDPGERFHRACLAVVTLADDAVDDVRRADSELRGRLRITAPEILGHELLLPAVAELRREHPGVRFELLFSDERFDLIDAGFDLAVRLGDPPKGLSAMNLGRAEQVYVASPELLGAAPHGPGAPRTLAKLGELPCIGRAKVERWSLGRRSLRVEPAVIVSTHEGLRRAACLGLGVARAPKALVSADLERGRLELLFDGRPAMHGPVHAVWQTGAYVPRRLELFLEVLARRARAWPPLGG